MKEKKRHIMQKIVACIVCVSIVTNNTLVQCCAKADFGTEISIFDDGYGMPDTGGPPVFTDSVVDNEESENNIPGQVEPEDEIPPVLEEQSESVPEIVPTQTPEGDIVIPEEEQWTDEEGDEPMEEIPLSENNVVTSNGVIRIFHFKQLQAIGSGTPVLDQDMSLESFGQGTPILDMDGTEVTYGLDCTYELANDIELDMEQPWTLPEGFCGRFQGETLRDDMPLYEQENDTVYVYHNYQLLVLSGGRGGEEPVLSMDIFPEMFGMGQLLYRDGTIEESVSESVDEEPIFDSEEPDFSSGTPASGYLTYSREHRYVLSKNFTEQMPKLESEVYAAEAAAQDQLSGRMHIGQVYTTIGNKKYILIGNEQQLRAIGSGKQVTPMLFIRGSGILGLGPTLIPYYPGDTDFNIRSMADTNVSYKVKDFYKSDVNYKYFQQKNPADYEELMNADLQNPDTLLGTVTGILGGLLGGVLGNLLGKAEIVGLRGENTGSPSIGSKDGLFSPAEYVTLKELKKEYDSLTYSSDQNYIVFRDINLSSGPYSNGKADDWKPLHLSGSMEGKLSMMENQSIRISEVHINQTTPMVLEKDSGIGFFGSIQNDMEKGQFHSAGRVSVKNMILDHVTVNNTSNTTTNPDPSLVEALLGVLGGVLGLVGGVLDILLPGNLKLDKVLSDLLILKQKSPDLFATGTFAGRIIGDVQIENCHVQNGAVSSVKGMSGGFVGYTRGETRYDGLSGALGTTVTALSALLNIIPGVGLGDLITVLLQNDVPLGQLIPTGYYRPMIRNCGVTLANGTIGQNTTDYNGGFVGIQIGTDMEMCHVSGLVHVSADHGAGGFAGVEREAQIMGLLTSLGVDLVNFDVHSTQTQCSVEGADFQIQAAQEYAGGMNGVMANSYAQSCAVKGLKTVSAVKYAGGFTGRATIGYGLAVGTEKDQKGTLLNSVTGLLATLVTPGNEGKLTTLLSISGAQPSKLTEISVSGTDWTVHADTYAGGLLGQGDGTKIGIRTPGGTGTNHIQGLLSVTATNYAGGVAGSIVAANPIGVLNSTLGVGHYLAFELKDTILEGSNLKINAANQYAAGGIGLLLGGMVSNVRIQNLVSVTAGNYAGGFAGRAGSGSLVREGGLDLLGLGLIKVDNLLSLAQAVNLKIAGSHVLGVPNGYIVSSSGAVSLTEGEDILAGGFISETEGVEITDSSAENLLRIWSEKPAASTKETFAGGFVGRSNTGGLAGVAQKESDGSLKLPGIVNVNGLLDLVPYLLSKYNNCKVVFLPGGTGFGTGEAQVTAAYAGGFFGEMESGKVNDTATVAEPYAVYGAEKILGEKFAGGFAGKIHAGATASSNGLNLLSGILKLNVMDLLGVLNVYIPKIVSAGVRSSGNGLIVEATGTDSCAGGYCGEVSGGFIDKSSVAELKHTLVTPPSNLESTDGSSYFSGQSSYAVKAGRYAGGYAGKADIGSAASVGGGLKLLNAIQLHDVLSVIDAVATKISDSNVYGQIGGFSVLANGTDMTGAVIGKAGGYVGECSGSKIQYSDSLNFAYIIGQEAAGGYVGHLEPGNVTAVLEESSILGSLVSVKDSLASLINSFIPIIENCQTTCVPCGGAVRAQGTTDTEHRRGMAGGYAGYNQGGRIRGDASKECAVIRLRSVYGGEFSGGFTGLMETGNLADTGNLGLLFGLLNTGNVLGLLGAVYPTEAYTAVYGPLRRLGVNTWNAWVDAVASGGVYGNTLPAKKVSTQEQLNALIREYAYGYHVRAGRTEPGSMEHQAGVAGGYVGRMKGGVTTEAHAWDGKQVQAYRSTGGFAGEMVTGGAASVGAVNLLSLPLTGALSAVQTFVPVIRNSDVTGYQSGMVVRTTGIPQQGVKVEQTGHAGGYVGHMIGGQIWGNYTGPSARVMMVSQTDAVPDPSNNRCFVHNLRRVDGTATVGGFAGQIDPGSAAALDTASSQGLLGGLLQYLITSPGDLLQVLNATLSTVRASDVKTWSAHGFLVNGRYSDGQSKRYAKAAGGFAGEINGAVLGQLNNSTNGNHVFGLKSVIGGEHAGGFFGLADVSAVANIGKQGANASILQNLLKLGSADVLDAFRTYVYDSSVTGSASGMEVLSFDGKKTGYINHPVYTGNSGGFGGTMLNGSVKRCRAENLRLIQGNNYAGGFIGHLGKSGVVDLDNLGVFNEVIGVGAGVLDTFGSHVDASSAIGIPSGYIVRSRNQISAEMEEVAGGFTGYADLSKMSGNTVDNLKQVNSPEIAGGFVGKTNFEYLANVKANSKIVGKLLEFLNTVLKALWVADLQQGKLIHINLGLITVDALYDGNLVHVNLLGLDVRIALAKPQQLATIYIGDSKIEVNCASDGSIDSAKNPNLKDEINLNLIKGNRSTIKDNKVTGISDGYDVYGGGAGNYQNGTHINGYAGGFAGLNREGLFIRNEMYLADVIRGTAGKTGPFVGYTQLDSVYNFNTVKGIEGKQNHYRVYRIIDPAFKDILGHGSKPLEESTSSTPTNTYLMLHRGEGKVEEFKDLNGAVLSNGTDTAPADVYLENGAMAKLMSNTPSEITPPDGTDIPPNIQDPCKDTVELQIQKVWKKDKMEDRPQAIVLTITRSYVDAQGQTVEDLTFKESVTMIDQDQVSENRWEKIIQDPKYTAYYQDPADPSKKYYYTYYVAELPLEGYKTVITYNDQYHYSVTITNEKEGCDQMLPETGGWDIRHYYMIGLLLLAVWGILEYRKQKNSRARSR